MRLVDVERQRLAERHEQRKRQLDGGGWIQRRREWRTDPYRSRAHRRTIVCGNATGRADAGALASAESHSDAKSHANASAVAKSDTCSDTVANAGSNANS